MTELVRHPALPNIPDTIEGDQRKWAKDLLDFVKRQAQATYDQQYHDDLIVKGPWIDIRAYGGDPTGTRDSTVAITDALAALSTSGGVIYFPIGTYRVDSDIAITDSHIMFKGAGRHKTVFDYRGSDKLFELSSTDYLVLEDMKLDGTNASGTNYGIHMGTSTFKITLSRVYIRAFSYGLYMDLDTYDHLIDDSEISHCGYGFYAKDGQATVFRHTYFHNNTTQAMEVGREVVITDDCRFENHSGVSKVINCKPRSGVANLSKIGIHDCWFDLNDGTEITIEDSAVTDIIGNQFASHATKVIDLINTVHTNIVGNNCDAYMTGVAADADCNHTVCLNNNFESATTPYSLNGKYVLIDDEKIETGNWPNSHNIVTLPNESTPTVGNGRVFVTGGTSSISDFDDGVTGQIITVIAEHDNVVIVDGTNIFLNGSANWTMMISDTLTLICKADNKWYEVARSDNT